jgi:cell division protein FtsI/penicillin-binding protein 2
MKKYIALAILAVCLVSVGVVSAAGKPDQQKHESRDKARAEREQAHFEDRQAHILERIDRVLERIAIHQAISDISKTPRSFHNLPEREVEDLTEQLEDLKDQLSKSKDREDLREAAVTLHELMTPPKEDKKEKQE